MTRGLILLCLCFALAACDDGQPQQNVVRIKTTNDQSDQLKAMAPLYRNLGLWRAIRDSGLKCKKVDNGGYQQDYKDMAMWAAHCTDTADHAVFIAPNGDVQVRVCSDLKSLGLPACRPIPYPPSDSPTVKR